MHGSVQGMAEEARTKLLETERALFKEMVLR